MWRRFRKHAESKRVIVLNPELMTGGAWWKGYMEEGRHTSAIISVREAGAVVAVVLGRVVSGSGKISMVTREGVLEEYVLVRREKS